MELLVNLLGAIYLGAGVYAYKILSDDTSRMKLYWVLGIVSCVAGIFYNADKEAWWSVVFVVVLLGLSIRGLVRCLREVGVKGAVAGN